MKQPQFVNGEFYHIINRGVEKRKIFIDNEDKLRFINSLLVFNDIQPTPWGLRGFWNQRGPTSLAKEYRPKNPFCEIHAFVLMRNHFHLLIRQLKDKGISEFMRKLGGYVYFFNKKYKRVGPLFQGKFKAVHIKDERQLSCTFSYIHTNPIEFIEKNWKEFKVRDHQSACNFLKEYQWSSYRDYVEKENFPTLITKDFFLDFFNGKMALLNEMEGCIKEKAIQNFIKYTKDMVLE